jgi:aryl-alcohol dehydrogenase-like predicted oxidoreductase
MATSLLDHDGPSDPEMQRAFEEGGIGLVASYALAGGTLTGKYRRPGSDGRAAGDDHPRVLAGKQLGERVAAVAERWGVPPSHVAFAFAFGQPHLASVLFGSSSPEQLRENVAARATFQQLDEQQRAELATLTEPPPTK